MPDRERLPPVDLLGARDAVVGEVPRVAETGDDSRMEPRDEAPQRPQVHVVVVIVADHDEIDRRQVLEADPRRSMPLRPDPGDGANTLRPDGVGEDVQAVHLDQHRRVIDEGDAEVAAGDTCRRDVGRDLLPLGPVPTPAGDDVQLAPQRVLDLPVLEGDVVVEAPPVEVVGDGTVIARGREGGAAGERA